MKPSYEEYKKMVYDLAWKQLKINPSLELNEMVAEANLAFCDARETWDPSKGCFSTHLWWKIRGRFSQINSKRAEWEKSIQIINLDISDLEETENPPKGLEDTSNPMATCALKHAIDGLSDEAKEVLIIVLKSADELCDFTGNRIMVNVTNIKKYFYSLGWTWNKIGLTIGEVRSMLEGL